MEMYVQREPNNPLRFILAASVISLSWIAYHLIRQHQINWIQVLGAILSIAFILAYMKKHSVAWSVALLMIVGFLPLSFAGFLRNPTAQLHSPLMIGSALTFWLGCIAYLIWSRRRYYSYILGADGSDE
jgi:uncharacterized membrane protein YfcA